MMLFFPFLLLSLFLCSLSFCSCSGLLATLGRLLLRTHVGLGHGSELFIWFCLIPLGHASGMDWVRDSLVQLWRMVPCFCRGGSHLHFHMISVLHVLFGSTSRPLDFHSLMVSSVFSYVESSVLGYALRSASSFSLFVVIPTHLGQHPIVYWRLDAVLQCSLQQCALASEDLFVSMHSCEFV
jgi:hypothetical protein